MGPARIGWRCARRQRPCRKRCDRGVRARSARRTGTNTIQALEQRLRDAEAKSAPPQAPGASCSRPHPARSTAISAICRRYATVRPANFAIQRLRLPPGEESVRAIALQPGRVRVDGLRELDTSSRYVDTRTPPEKTFVEERMTIHRRTLGLAPRSAASSRIVTERAAPERGIRRRAACVQAFSGPYVNDACK